MKFTVYKDTKGEWRWTLTGNNGEPLAVSSEGYKNYGDCGHAMKLVQGCGQATVEGPPGMPAPGSILSMMMGTD